MAETKTQIIGKSERHYARYRNDDKQLVDPTTPKYYVYNPNSVQISSGVPTKESTGVYYFDITLSSGDANVNEGWYKIWWEGTIESALVTMDDPHYFFLKRYDWQMGIADEIIQSVRRMIGDTDPDNYRINTQDMYYYLADSVNDVQTYYPMGYSVTVSPQSLTFNKTVTALAKSLFKLKSAEIIITSVLFDVLFDAANINLGDIKINMRDTIVGRRELKKELKDDFEKLVRNVKMNTSAGGLLVDNYIYSRYGSSITETDL